MTGQIRLASRKRDRLLKIYPRFKLSVSWDRYRVQRNLVVSFNRKTKINYNIKINQALSDPAIPSKKWKGVVKSECYSAILAICEGGVLYLIQKQRLMFTLITSRVKQRYQITTLLKFHFSLGGRQTLNRWSVTFIFC